MTNILQVEGLSKRFGSVVTAEKLTFDVKEGSALGIVGPNGAGKSTLLSLITGVETPNAGSLNFAGTDITSLPTTQRAHLGIARTFQIPRPFTEMTVFENVYVAASFGRGLHGQAGYEASVDALTVTGLIQLAEEKAGSLRLLDRKRLELARALATNPKLILLDEIAGGLTDRELPPLIELIKSLKARGITVIWIEHIVHALTSVVDELMCLAFGQILARGLPEDVMKNPDVIKIYLGTTFDAGVA